MVDVCSESPCGDGGICTVTSDSYMCICSPGYILVTDSESLETCEGMH